MLKNKIVTLDNGSEYYIGDDVKFDNGEHYCCASRYNKETQDCEENFRVFKIENKNNDLTIVPVENAEIARYVMEVIANRATN